MTQGVHVLPHTTPCQGCNDHTPHGRRYDLSVGNMKLTLCLNCLERLIRQAAPYVGSADE